MLLETDVHTSGWNFGLLCFAVTLGLTHQAICILLYIPPISFFFFLEGYTILLRSLLSHAFPASSCSPFLFLSSVLIEIQLCNSLSEDTIDLAPSCVFEEHRQEEKGRRREGWLDRERERGRGEQEAGRKREKGVKEKKKNRGGGGE